MLIPAKRATRPSISWKMTWFSCCSLMRPCAGSATVTTRPRALAEQPLDRQRQPPSVAHALNAAWFRRQAIEKDETDPHVVSRRVDEVAQATKQFVGQVIDHG